jgi:hypothetical protein
MPMGHHPLITKWPSYRLDVHHLNDMVYVYYNLRLWVRQIDKVPNTDAISLDVLDTTSPWRVETKRPVMEEAPEWLEHDVDELEEEEVSEDVPLPGETDLEQEEDIESVSQPVPPPPQRQATRGRGRRHPTSASTLSPGVAPSTSGSTSTRPPTASRGKAPTVTFAHKRGRGNH